MLYFSLNKKSASVNFKTATLQGQAPDKGLYFPAQIPKLPKGFTDVLQKLSKEEMGTTVMAPYVGDNIPIKVLEDIIHKTLDFPFPLVPLSDAVSTLELFHGPTLAFKDVGARFMSECLGYFIKKESREITVLVATSGDTGGAVANGFYGVEGINVVILYPAGKVSAVQELQLTTLGKNITALQVQGDFDNCQQMVKEAFADAAVQHQLNLTSANSINIARWLPQQLYYFLAYQQWPYKNEPPVISVPSGNFGNICAGLLAYQSGLPARHFIAACNANDVVPRYLQNGNYNPQGAVATLSNAMDVGSPSNFVRIMQLYGQQFIDLKKHLSSISISDIQTTAAMRKVFDTFGYIADPHGAVAYAALEKHLALNRDQKGYFIETAHPVKFLDIVEKTIGKLPAIPPEIALLNNKPKQSVAIKNDYAALKDFLLQMK